MGVYVGGLRGQSVSHLTRVRFSVIYSSKSRRVATTGACADWQFLIPEVMNPPSLWVTYVYMGFLYDSLTQCHAINIVSWVYLQIVG